MQVNNTHIGNMSMMPGFTPVLAMPDPILDQLQISIWNGLGKNIVLPEFLKAFGNKPWLNKKNQRIEFQQWDSYQCSGKYGVPACQISGYSTCAGGVDSSPPAFSSKT